MVYNPCITDVLPEHPGAQNGHLKGIEFRLRGSHKEAGPPCDEGSAPAMESSLGRTGF